MKDNKYTHRFLARIIIEATSPIAIGTGQKEISTDSLVALDANGLPYIPGTSIAGVIRHAIGEEHAQTYFGKQSANSKECHGSDIIFTDARFVAPDGTILDGLQNIDFNDEFFRHFAYLPIRQHVRIDHRGTAEDNGKFDEQVVYKGTRFCFEIEMVSKDSADDNFKQVLQKINSEGFCLGSGSRSGLGAMRVVDCQTKILDLQKESDLEFYINKSSNLNQSWLGNRFDNQESSNHIIYDLSITPVDFFSIGSGYGDTDVDMTPTKEACIVWHSGTAQFCEQCVLIPGSSLKGALSHRTAYHYNLSKHVYAEQPDTEIAQHIGKKNLAVVALFGSEGEMDNKEMKHQLRGNVIIPDIIRSTTSTQDKILNHVSIDRFTGGAIDGALYSEKVVETDGHPYCTTIAIDHAQVLSTIKKVLGADGTPERIAEEYERVNNAFLSAINDLCHEMLPLGGGVNRGHGIFQGTCTLRKEEIHNA